MATQGLARRGGARRVEAGKATHVAARPGMDWHGGAGVVSRGEAWEAWHGGVTRGRQGVAW